MSAPSVLQITWMVLWLATLVVCVHGIVRGGPPERLGSLVILLGALLAEAGLYVPPEARSTVILLIDGVAALALLLIAVRYASLWLGGIMVLQATQFTLHSVYTLSERAPDTAYSIINNVNFVGQLLCLVIGTFAAARKRRRAAADTFIGPIGQHPIP